MRVIQLNGGALYQWDTGRQVELHPTTNCTVDEVHFLNPNGATAYVVKPTTKDDVVVADIPNVILQTAVNVRVYAVMTTENGERTVSDCTFGVNPRQKPSDYVYTETEVRTYEALEERIKELEKGGADGADGKSAYEIAVDNGFDGTEAEWLASLKGADGKDGTSLVLDSSLDENSTNGVENQVVAKAIKAIPIEKANELITLTNKTEVLAYEWDAGKVYIAKLSSLVDSGLENQIYGYYACALGQHPSKGSVLRMYCIGNNSSFELDMDTGELVETTPTAKNVTVADTEENFDGSDVETVLQEIGKKLKSPFKGKTAAFFGDSLTEENYHYTKGYHQWVKELLGLESYHNYGKSGAGYADVYNKVCNVAHPADIVFVGAGVNEQTYSVPLGTISDLTTDTTYGRLNLLCARIKDKYPTSVIIFITPHYQTKYPSDLGITSHEVGKAVKNVCEKFAIPVFDNFALSGICDSNLAIFTTDNCHWNDTAHEMVGKNLAEFVSNNIKYCYGYTANTDWTGKTVTCNLHSNPSDKFVNMVALIAVDDDVTNGSVITAELSGTDCVNMITKTKSGGGHIYGDDSGETGNGKYNGTLSSGTIVHSQTVSAENTMVCSIPERTISKDVTVPYIKVPLLVFGSYPFSFKISDISVKVNGTEKPILAIGSFFNSTKEIITVN